MVKKYLSTPVKITVETEAGNVDVYVRPKAKAAIIPGVGKVNLPEYLEEQADLQKKLANAKKSKQVGTVSELVRKITLPDVLLGYNLEGDDTALFDIRKGANDFHPDSVEEATEGVEELKVDLEDALGAVELWKGKAEALEAEVTELKAKVEALENTAAGSEDSGK